MKSAGSSLKRAVKSLTVFILLLSIVAFLFSNNVIPFAEYKFFNFRKNIAQAKPALAITEGQFSDLRFYKIKVNKKVINAKDGLLISNEKSSILQLVLNNGYYYEDITPKKYEDRSKMPFAKSTFKKYIINIDLSQLNKTDTNDQSIANTNTMLNVSELNYTLDSLHKTFKTDIISFSENMNQR